MFETDRQLSLLQFFFISVLKLKIKLDPNEIYLQVSPMRLKIVKEKKEQRKNSARKRVVAESQKQDDVS